MSKTSLFFREHLHRQINTSATINAEEKLSDYLFKDRNDTYYLRVCVPTWLRNLSPAIPKDVKKSARTKDKHEALIFVGFQAKKLNDLFKKLEIDRPYVGDEVIANDFKRLVDSTLTTHLLKQDSVPSYSADVIRLLGYSQPTQAPRMETSSVMGTEPALSLSQVRLPPEPKNESQAMLLSELIKLYLKSIKNSRKNSEKTEAEREACLNLLIKFLGDKPIDLYTATDFLNLQGQIQKLPSNMNKDKRYRDKPLEQILKMKVKKPIKSRTVNKYLEKFISLFKFAEDKYFITRNYAKNLLIKEDGKTTRKPFTEAELNLLFSTPQYSPDSEKKFSKPHQYWGLLLALFTGARLNEICQLHVCDIQMIDSIWCISINDDTPDKKLKTQNSKRPVPIHDKLIELGFLKYVSKLGARGEQRLFPELKLQRDGYGASFSKYFNDYKTALGITSNEKVFHSFRHTFSNNLYQKLVNESLVEALIGHLRRSTLRDHYVQPYKVSTLKEAIDKLDYKLPEIKKFI